jgi:hypothetical protein
LAAGFGDDGAAVDHLSKTYTVTVKKDAYERFLKDGFVYDFYFPIIKPGAYQMRIALRDHTTGKTGSANQFVEVPNVKKGGLVLSGVYLENPSLDEWTKRMSMSAAEVANTLATNTLSDTSLRQFKRGTVLNYGFTIFNAKLDSARRPDLTLQIKVFRDGKPLLEGTPKRISSDGQPDLTRIGMVGSLNLGTDMQSGDYILQLIVRDGLAGAKHQTATQFVQFEMVE